MATDGWKHVRVYVASGYFDMEGERRHLMDVVLPQVRQQCILFRTQVHLVDLRVGLNEASWSELIAAKGCAPLLEEVDRCRPFFLGLYGQKYGTPLADYKLPREPHWSKLRSGLPAGRSMLEVESFWAALQDPQACQGLFLFRDPSFAASPKFQADVPLYCTAELSHPLTSKFPERKSDLSIGATFLSASPQERLQLEELKSSLRTAMGPTACAVYTAEYQGPVGQLPILGRLEGMGKLVASWLFDQVKLETRRLSVRSCICLARACPVLLDQVSPTRVLLDLMRVLFAQVSRTFSLANSALDLLEAEQAYHKVILDQHLQQRLVGRDNELRQVPLSSLTHSSLVLSVCLSLSLSLAHTYSNMRTHTRTLPLR